MGERIHRHVQAREGGSMSEYITAAAYIGRDIGQWISAVVAVAVALVILTAIIDRVRGAK